MPKLKQDNVLQETKEMLNRELKTISENNNHEVEIEDLWNKIKISITSATEEELRSDNVKYKELHRRVLKAIKAAKERWLQEKCVEIEILKKNTALTFIGK